MKSLLVAAIAAALICVTPNLSFTFIPNLSFTLINDAQLVGWSAAALTLMTFAMRSMLTLRMTALAANFCFISYGALMDLAPVLALHLLLIPCNVLRIAELLREQRRTDRSATTNPLELSR